MSRQRYCMLCLLSVAGAFAGGYVANRTVPVAHAQVPLAPMELRGSAFILVNPQGQTEATLRNGANGPQLTLNGARGGAGVELSPSGGLIIRDQFGRITWRSPKGSGIMPLNAE